MPILQKIAVLLSLSLVFWLFPGSVSSKQDTLVFSTIVNASKQEDLPFIGPLPVPQPVVKPKPKVAPKPQPKPAVVAVGDQKLTVVSWIKQQCVTYVYARTGNDNLLGYKTAGKIPVNSQTPIVGAVVITSEGAYGHAAYVVAIEDDNLVLDEANYIDTNYKSGGPVTAGRVLPISSPLIKGYVVQTD